MELQILLKDDIFVDFFNTFLSLPVKRGTFLHWLQTHRMVFFKQTELYHSFVLVSEILKFVSCRSADDLKGLLSRDHPLISQKSVLAEMRRNALNQLQSYWLPHFLHNCKSWLWRVPECRPLVDKYVSFSSPSSHSHSKFKQESGNLDSPGNPATCYCSKHSKQQLWSSRMPSFDQLQARSICLWLPTTDHKNSQCSNVVHLLNTPLIIQDLANNNADIPHTCVPTPSCQIPLCLNVQSPPSDLHCFLQPALSADSLSGGPFREFLRAQKLKEKETLLDLLEDLDFFLLLLLKSQGSNPVCEERQAAAKTITETRLKSSENGLDPHTSQQLRLLLPSGAAVPWIYAAKHQLCRQLQDVYTSFLDAEDEALLSLLSLSRDEFKNSEPLHFSFLNLEEDALLNQTESLVLSEGCCSRLEPRDLTRDDWALVAFQDPQRGGSLLQKRSTFDLHVSKNNGVEVQTKPQKKDSIIYEKPSLKPRSFEQAMTSPQYINHFKQFLQAHGADGALLFLQEAEALRSMEHKRKKPKTRSIVDKFFRREDPEVYLQCSSDIIRSVAQMDNVSSEIIYTIHKLVSKSLEAVWFKQYQQSFNPCSSASESESSIRGPQLKGNVRGKGWEVFMNLIRSLRKFRSAMANHEIRFEFEDYLIHNYEHFSTSHINRAKVSQGSEVYSNTEKFRLMVRSIRDKVVVVNFLANDLSFFLECERFRRMADINSTETQRENIIQRFASGKVDRTLFYQPMIDVLPVLIFCWRRWLQTIPSFLI
ncbi:hypothetical protein DNTS_007624 [Danionella cerebrum]|uniref:RGS domain-containing protein n=1 Tax=Danionella cerebrum TaxID=2873325 RepID=A0A553MZL3_9TELE|nr:hypothetical protein DNTS_007624 [Danionella translucida]TRY58626.1 hypothetical protein DNTS_007624 [Danionella translucida]